MDRAGHDPAHFHYVGDTVSAAVFLLPVPVSGDRADGLAETLV